MIAAYRRPSAARPGLAAYPWVLARKRQRSLPSWAIPVVVVVVLVLLAILRYVPVFDLGGVSAGPPTGVAQALLEPDPAGAAVGLVLSDLIGRDTTMTGDLTIEVREPDGAVWRTTRSVLPRDFGPLPSGGLLAGRLGYRVVIPASAWPRPPRRGSTTSILVSVAPSDTPAFSSTFSSPFP